MSKYTKEQLIEFFEYLDDLRESGTVNMLGASPSLREEFDLGKSKSRSVLSLWMITFSTKKAVEERVVLAIQELEPE